MASNDIELVKMSGKGQLVVPQDVREMAHLIPGERFVAFPVDEGVLFKRVNIPKVKLDFQSLAKDVQKQFEKNKVTKEDIKEAIKWSKR